MSTAVIVRPKKNVLFGVTHTLDGKPVVRVPRAVKLGIGQPAGKDVEVYIDFDGTWVIRTGDKFGRYKTRDSAMSDWQRALRAAPERKHPKKLDYFTFTKPGSVDFDPDFHTIERHGSKPREIDIEFVDDEPLQQSFQLWSKSELRCEGDGINAMRSFAFAAETLPNGKQLVDEARENGLDRVPIIDGCFACGCCIKDCRRPTSILSFQLKAMPRLGSTAYFHSTSFRTATNLWSTLYVFRVMTGRGDPARGFVAGIPLKLLLRPHKVKTPDGKTGTAYNVALEFQDESANVLKLRQQMLRSGLEYARLQEPPKQIAAPAPKPDPVEAVPVEETKGTAATHDDEGEDFQDVSAEAVAAEFYPDDAGDEDTHTERGTDPDTEPPSGSAEAADELGELKASMMRAGRSEAVIQQVTAHYSKLIGEGMLPDKAIRQVVAADLANVEPAGPAENLNREEIVTQGQWVDMVTYAKDELKMSEADLKNVVKKHGHASGDLTTMPKSVFRSVMDDLQTPRTARTQEVSIEKKTQRKFSL